MRVALDIGHSLNSQGASGIYRDKVITEFIYNEEIAKTIKSRLVCDIDLVYRKTYSTLPYDINKLNPDFIVSLHCNAFNTQASGTEVLYWHTSTNGKRLASILQKHLLELGFNDRGIKPLQSNDRGGLLLEKTKAPCVLCEPFFIDNPNDLQIMMENKEKLADLYIKGILEYAD
jgi:N-acetylmuramoyl-L-alanine amidase